MGFLSSLYTSSFIALSSVESDAGDWRLDGAGFFHGNTDVFRTLPREQLIALLRRVESIHPGHIAVLCPDYGSDLASVDIVRSVPAYKAHEFDMDFEQEDIEYLQDTPFGDLTDEEVVVGMTRELGLYVPDNVTEGVLRLLTSRLYIITHVESAATLCDEDLLDIQDNYPGLELEPAVMVSFVVDQFSPETFRYWRSQVFIVRDSQQKIVSVYEPVACSPTEEDDMTVYLKDVTAFFDPVHWMSATSLDGVTSGYCLLFESEPDVLSLASVCRLDKFEQLCRASVGAAPSLFTSFLLGRQVSGLEFSSMMIQDTVVD